MKKIFSLFAALLFVGSMMATEVTYKLVKVTSVSAGNLYVFEQNSHVFNNTCASSALQTTATYKTVGLAGTESYVWTLETVTGGFYLKNVSLTSNQYLNNASKTTVSLGSASSIWTITFTNGVALISNKSNNDRFLGQPAETTYTYKAYATSNLDDYPHDITVYQLVEEADCDKKVTLSLGTPENGSFTINKLAGEYPTCEEALEVIVTPSPATHYHVDEIIAPNSASISGPDSEGKYTVTYAKETNAASEINVTFEESQAYDVTWNINGATSTTSVYEGEQPEFPATPVAFDAVSKTFVGWATTAWSGTANPKDKTIYTKADDMPAVDGLVTYYAVFAKATESTVTKTYGFEDEETYADDWTINGPAKDNAYKASGSYAGKINTNNTYVTFNDKVSVTNFSFQFARTSTNNNYSVIIETSEDGSAWTAAQTTAMSTFASDGTFSEVSKDFDGKTELYVRFHCSNTTAVRYVDDLSITYNGLDYTNYITTSHAVTIAATTNGSIKVYNGTTEISSGQKFTAGTELTVEATPASGYQLATLTANGENIKETKTFTVDTEDVEIVATFSSATGVDNAEASEKVVKTMENGVLIIRRGDKTYNGQGQIVK